jgi:hypothetical protein
MMRYDDMPRTTLRLTDDVLRLAKAYAARNQLTLGEAVNDLVRKGAERPLVTEEKNGLQVVRLDRRSPKVSAAQVERLRDDLP